jgi:hypothetical protein
MNLERAPSCLVAAPETGWDVMRNSAGETPDFICVGTPKAGTGRLFNPLQFHCDLRNSAVANSVVRTAIFVS